MQCSGNYSCSVVKTTVCTAVKTTVFDIIPENSTFKQNRTALDFHNKTASDFHNKTALDFHKLKTECLKNQIKYPSRNRSTADLQYVLDRKQNTNNKTDCL